MHTYKQEAAAMIDSSVKFYFGKVLQEYRVVSERELQDATFFFMEYIEHCNSTDTMMIYELCSQYAEITLWSKPEMADVRQNTIYGLGLLSKYMTPQAFKSMLPNTLKSIDLILSNLDA